jgi:HPt (histidine-containing phosphotransfer) domain-containing protein
MNDKIIDLTYLDSISEEDLEFKKDMIETFLANTPVYLSEMKTSLAQKDWKKIGNIAHSIKPSFTLMGMNENKEALLKIEEYGRNLKNTKKIPDLIQELEIIINRAITELNKKLDEMG